MAGAATVCGVTFCSAVAGCAAAAVSGRLIPHASSISASALVKPEREYVSIVGLPLLGVPLTVAVRPPTKAETIVRSSSAVRAQALSSLVNMSNFLSSTSSATSVPVLSG